MSDLKASTMKAMVMTRAAPANENPLELKELNIPKIKNKNDVLVRIEACGVCRSNMHMIEGEWQKYGVPSKLPIVPGHEVVGSVVQVGTGVKKLRKGQRIGIQPLYKACMNCQYCKSGRDNICDDGEYTGETTNGGYAQYITVNENFTTVIPENIDPVSAAPLFCPGVTAYKAIKESNPELGKTVGIFGIGGVGHMAIQFAKLAGMRTVAVSRNKKHLSVARKVGADSVFEYAKKDFDQEQFLESIRKEENGGLDSALIFAPSDDAIDTAIKSVKKGGTIVLGVFGTVSNFLFPEEKIMKGTVIGTTKDMQETIKIASQSKLKVVTKQYKLEEANDALAKLKATELESRAVLVPS